MRIPKFVGGIGINLALETLSRLVSNFYERFKKEKDDLVKNLDQYIIADEKAGIKGSIGNLAKRYNLEDRLLEYKNNAVNTLRDSIAYARNNAEYLRENLTNKPESSLYAKAQKAYNALSSVLLYIPRVGPFIKKINYVSDAVHYIRNAGDLTYKIKQLLDLADSIDKDKTRLSYALLARTTKWVGDEIRKIKGIPVSSLEGIIGAAIKPRRMIVDNLRDSAGKILTDYKDLIMSRRPIYGGDFAHSFYAAV